MRGYLDITGKYLRAQKRRSVLTVVGIILSVALVTGIGTIFLSMYNANLRSTISNYGDYYASVPSVPGDKAGVLAQNVLVAKAGVARDVGFAAYAENEKNGLDTPYKYLDVKAMDTAAMSMLPGYDLKDGRLPQAPGEIAVDDWTLKYLPKGTEIGSTITLSVGTRTLPDGAVAADSQVSSPDEIFTAGQPQKFTLVGTLKPRYVITLNFANALTYLDGASLPDTQKVTVYLKLKSVNSALQRIQGITSSAGLQTGKGESNEIQYNDHLLKLYAQGTSSTFNSSFLTVMVVIVLLVVLATIAVIYNAFNISVVERVSQFGLLRCVGATPVQIRSIVFREALALGVIGIPIGELCGTLAMSVVFRVISAIAPGMLLGGLGGSGGLQLLLSPWLVASSALVGAVTIWLSALLPARKAARISPMEAVRGASVLKKEKYSRSDRRRVVLKLLGAEGWLAWKNLGRNRKRFYITVLSMVISIVLFIVFSSLVGYAHRSGAVDTENMPSYLIQPKNGIDRLDTGALSGVAALPGVDYAIAYSNAYAEADIPSGKMNPRAEGILESNYGAQRNADGSVHLLNNELICVGDADARTLANLLGVASLDAEAFERGEGVVVANSGELIDRRQSKDVLTGITALKAGDRFAAAATSGAGDTPKTVTKQLSVLAVAEKNLPGYGPNQAGGIYIIVSEKLFHELAPLANFPTNLMITMKQGADSAAVQQLVDSFMEQNPNMNLSDLNDYAKSYNQTWVVMGIFLYGFVTVISLIGCLNIINTISTNIILRTRELSILRAIGMSDGGVRKLVALESVLYGSAAALIGSLAGTALSWLVYTSLMRVREFPWTLPWSQILIAVGAAALVAVVSGAVPLRRINSAVITEGICGEE